MICLLQKSSYTQLILGVLYAKYKQTSMLSKLSTVLIGVCVLGWAIGIVFVALYTVQSQQKAEPESQICPSCPTCGPECPACKCEACMCPNTTDVLYETPYYLMNGSYSVKIGSNTPSVSTTSQTQIVLRGSDGGVQSGIVQEGDSVTIYAPTEKTYISRTGGIMYNQVNAALASKFQFMGGSGALQLGTEYSWHDTNSTAGYTANSNNTIVFDNTPGMWRFVSTSCV